MDNDQSVRKLQVAECLKRFSLKAAVALPCLCRASGTAARDSLAATCSRSFDRKTRAQQTA